MRTNKLEFICDAANSYGCPVSKAVKSVLTISGNISHMALVAALEAEGFIIDYPIQDGGAYRGAIIKSGTSGCANPLNQMNMPKGTKVPADLAVAIGWIDTHEEALLYAILGYFRECLIESRDKDHLTVPDALHKWIDNAIKPKGVNSPVVEAVSVKPAN